MIESVTAALAIVVGVLVSGVVLAALVVLWIGRELSLYHSIQKPYATHPRLRETDLSLPSDDDQSAETDQESGLNDDRRVDRELGIPSR